MRQHYAYTIIKGARQLYLASSASMGSSVEQEGPNSARSPCKVRTKNQEACRFIFFWLIKEACRAKRKKKHYTKYRPSEYQCEAVTLPALCFSSKEKLAVCVCVCVRERGDTEQLHYQNPKTKPACITTIDASMALRYTAVQVVYMLQHTSRTSTYVARIITRIVQNRKWWFQEGQPIWPGGYSLWNYATVSYNWALGAPLALQISILTA